MEDCAFLVMELSKIWLTCANGNKLETDAIDPDVLGSGWSVDYIARNMFARNTSITITMSVVCSYQKRWNRAVVRKCRVKQNKAGAKRMAAGQSGWRAGQSRQSSRTKQAQKELGAL